MSSVVEVKLVPIQYSSLLFVTETANVVIKSILQTVTNKPNKQFCGNKNLQRKKTERKKTNGKI